MPEDGIWYPERFPGTGITLRSKSGIRNAPTSLYVKGLRIVMQATECAGAGIPPARMQDCKIAGKVIKSILRVVHYTAH
jgi:hypothetical protein